MTIITSAQCYIKTLVVSEFYLSYYNCISLSFFVIYFLCLHQRVCCGGKLLLLAYFKFQVTSHNLNFCFFNLMETNNNNKNMIGCASLDLLGLQKMRSLSTYLRGMQETRDQTPFRCLLRATNTANRSKSRKAFHMIFEGIKEQT